MIVVAIMVSLIRYVVPTNDNNRKHGDSIFCDDCYVTYQLTIISNYIIVT